MLETFVSPVYPSIRTMNSPPRTKPSSRLSGLNPARLVRSLRGQKKVIESTDFDEPPVKEEADSRPRSKSSVRGAFGNRNSVNFDSQTASAATAEFGNAKVCLFYEFISSFYLNQSCS